MIQKHSSAGTGHTVVAANGVRHIYATASPRFGNTLEEQAHDALRQIEALYRDESAEGCLVHQAVFVREPADVEPCRRLIREFYGKDLPATSYILQQPCDGRLLAIEAMGLTRGHGVSIQRLGERMVIARHDGVSWAHMANVRVGIDAPGVYDQATACFAAMREALLMWGLRFDQVIRTWLYLGDIVGPDGDTQRYKELNRARTDFYKGVSFCMGHLPPEFNRPVYPASTGIGANGHDLVMSAIAFAADRDDITLLPLENPRQTSACDYPVQYGPRSPKFSRAMAICGPKYATTLISGTASITASETRRLNDAGGQTDETLDNIAALVSEENFRYNQRPGYGGTLENLALARVYIKRAEDYPAVREVCRRRLGELPTIYAVADVCRPELLVEIEGIAFTPRA